MKKIKIFVKYLSGILLGFLVLISLYTLLMTSLFKKDFANIFGYTYFIVTTGSMSGTIEVNDIVIVDLNSDYKKNDIITYKENDAFVTHRVISETGNTVIARGDANNVDDNPIDKTAVLGKVTTIISASMMLKILGAILILILIISLMNFDNIIKKYVFSKKDLKKEETPLDYTQKIDKITAQMLSIYVPSLTNVIDDREKLDKTDQEEEFLSLSLKLLKIKEKELKVTKKGSLKLKYLYKLANTILINPKDSIHLLENLPFDELYDYKFEEIGFYKNMQDKLYEMPIYVYIEVLLYSIICNNDYYFDAVFKMLKYRIKIERKNKFLQKNNNLNKTITLMEIIVDNSENANAFEFKNILESIKTQKEIENLQNIKLKKEPKKLQ